MTPINLIVGWLSQQASVGEGDGRRTLWVDGRAHAGGPLATKRVSLIPKVEGYRFVFVPGHGATGGNLTVNGFDLGDWSTNQVPAREWPELWPDGKAPEDARIATVTVGGVNIDDDHPFIASVAKACGVEL